MRHFLLLYILCALIGVQSVSAHGDEASFEEVKSEYTIDIGYPKKIVAGEASSFDFDVRQVNGTSTHAYENVWVTITQGKKLFFAGGLHKPRLGPTVFSFVFPSEGTYTISSRFEKSDKEIVESSFPVQVLVGQEDGGKTNSHTENLFFGALGLALGGLISYSVLRKRFIQ